VKLKQAATYFDRLVCQDAYGTATFKAQLGLFRDSMRDSSGSVRRTLSTAPNVVIPSRRVIVTDDKTWLIGESHPDYFKKGLIRCKYTLHQAEGLAHIRSFSELLADDAGVRAYAAKVWIRAAKQIEISSDLFNIFDIYFAAAETLVESCVVSLAREHYIVHDVYESEAGFRVGRASQLPDAVVEVTLRDRAYDPITDTWAEAMVTTDALRMRWQEHFKYFAQYSTRYEHGDQQFIVRQAEVPTVKAGDMLTWNGQPYQVEVAYDEGEVWSIHGRPA
jgi:hypothetical protein